MLLPLMPPVRPMLSKAVDGLDDLPAGADLVFEPKWDGFRCIAFRDGDEVELGSRNERPLTRYFPDVVEALRLQLPSRVVVDGEIVVVGQSGLDFDALLQRIHPAASRVERLAVQTPASFIAFDLLALGDSELTGLPFHQRRAELETALAGVGPPVHLTPATRSRDQAADWFTRFEGAGLDGVMAKPTELTYQPDKRVMYKVKHHRTADCAVAGFRWHKSGDGVGSFLLGLYDQDGTLHHVGVASSFSAKLRRTLAEEVEPLRAGALDGHPWREWAEVMAHEAQRLPGAQSRWNAGKDLSWEPLRVERVAEVAFEQLQHVASPGGHGGRRFRHSSRFRRWRPDRDPASCTYDQLDVAVPFELAQVFGAGR
ncbi:MAG: ATP-dependent DNA ligase [Acidimicrobiia bacterium]